MEQGSPEWHKLRRNKIGASDAPVIMGVSPWTSITTLWEEKTGLKERACSNWQQQRGLNLEEEARQYFYLITGYQVRAGVYLSKEYDWMMASLDGITLDEQIAVEIKCPGKKDHDIALAGNIPDKYYPQLQHQIEVLGLDSIYYLSFDGNEGKLLTCVRNNNYIKKLIDKEKEFYECVQNFIPPPIHKMRQEKKK